VFGLLFKTSSQPKNERSIMRNLKEVQSAEVDGVIRTELVRAGIPCLESPLRNPVGTRLAGIIQFKRGKKVVTFQRAKNSWYVHINAIFRGLLEERLNSLSDFTDYCVSTERDHKGKVIKSGYITKFWRVKNQKHMALLVRILTDHYGGTINFDADWDDLFNKSLLKDFQPV